jgi:hypothetical protein
MIDLVPFWRFTPNPQSVYTRDRESDACYARKHGRDERLLVRASRRLPLPKPHVLKKRNILPPTDYP